MPLIIKDTSQIWDKKKINSDVGSREECETSAFETANSNKLVDSNNINCSININNSNNSSSIIEAKSSRTKEVVTSVKKLVTKEDVINERLNKKKLVACGRPKVNIDKEIFEKLCNIQCTIEEICGFFRTDNESLAKWCKKTYGYDSFEETFNVYSAEGKISLRRLQFQTAKKNARMQIWLGKQMLHQTEYREPVVADTTKAVELLQAIKAEAQYYKSDQFTNIQNQSDQYDDDYPEDD